MVFAKTIGKTKVSKEELLRPLEERRDRIRTSPLYLVGLLVVAAAMALLPLVYLGLIGLLAWGLYFHASHNVDILEHVGGIRGRLVAYVGPLIIGGVLIVFMIKPLFSRPARTQRRISLVRQNEPLLFDFVEALCRNLGTPLPRRIDVDLDVNAAAGFRRGWLSFLGNDLVLLLGLPLVAGLSVRELAGVMAHEFGHFSQGLAMRLQYVIQSVNGWFARVVHERDSWDQGLDDFAEGAGGWASLVAHLARFFVWLTRRLLWLLMQAAHALSCMLSRQMEYSADRRQIRVAGSEAFTATFLKMYLLSVCQQRSFGFLEDMYRARRLPDNLPVYITSMARQAPPELVAALRDNVDETSTGLLSTHPSTRDRVSRAEQQNEAGILQLDQPATELFSDFDALAQEVTRFFYQGVIGSLETVKLVPTTDAVREERQSVEQDEALRRYVQGTWEATRPFVLPATSVQAPLEVQEAIETLRRTRGKLEPAFTQARIISERLLQNRELLRLTHSAEVLIEAGYKLKPEAFRMKEATEEAARAAQARAQSEIQTCKDRLASFDAAQGKRLMVALGLLSTPEMAEKLSGADGMLERCDLVLPKLVRLNALVDVIVDLGQWGQSTAALLQAAKGLSRAPTGVERVMRRVRELLAQVHADLENESYPFEHAGGRLSIGSYLVEEDPVAGEGAQTVAAARLAIERFGVLYARLLAEAATAGLQVESAIGLSELPLPAQST